jgi:hypothetical protein
MHVTSATAELILLTHAAYLRLKHDLKAAGLDLCYAAQAAQPIRLDWSAALFQDAKFLQQVEQRRPADASYRIASVQYTKKGGWFRPDEFTITFHAVSSVREADLQQYLRDHQVRSSTEAPKALLGAV